MFFLARVFPRNLSLQRLFIQSRTESSKSAQVEQVLVTELSEDFQETEEEKEARIDKIRNKSRLAPQHRNKVHGRLPYPESKAFYHDSIKYKRRAWARYGEESKVYPGIAWPDKEELEDKKEYERVQCPLSIQEMVAIEKKKIEDKESAIAARYESIVQKVEQNDAFIKAFHEKQAKKAKEAEESKKQKEKMFNDIRQHFGFNIDPNDEKFQEMMEIKKKEEAKKRRMEKKKQREEHLIKMALELEKQSSGDSKEAEKKVEPIVDKNSKKESE